MAMLPVHNPRLPKTLDINGMFVGKSFSVYGSVHAHVKGFQINLMSGDDMALHFNPRFNERKVVRNTRQHGTWGKEERDGGFPFSAGELFFLDFLCTDDHFRIQANSYKTYTTYHHRIPFHTIKQMEIVGDVDVTVVASSIKGLEIPVQVISSPPLTVNADIPFFNFRKHSVTITGRPTDNTGKFGIDFYNKNGKKLFFHFNPRMNEKQIVRNSRSESEGFGEEERDLNIPFPFENLVPFELKIHVEKSSFRVELNGWPLLEFRHQLRPMKGIKVMQIGGDVEIGKITFA